MVQQCSAHVNCTANWTCLAPELGRCTGVRCSSSFRSFAHLPPGDFPTFKRYGSKSLTPKNDQTMDRVHDAFPPEDLEDRKMTFYLILFHPFSRSVGSPCYSILHPKSRNPVGPGLLKVSKLDENFCQDVQDVQVDPRWTCLWETMNQNHQPKASQMPANPPGKWWRLRVNCRDHFIIFILYSNSEKNTSCQMWSSAVLHRRRHFFPGKRVNGYDRQLSPTKHPAHKIYH